MRNPPESGFSLIEILAVMAIIGIVAALSTASLANFAKGSGVRSGVNALSSAMLVARAQARTQGEPVFLLIQNDPSEPERYLRYTILARKVDSEFRPVGKAFYFPSGVYLSTSFSDLTPSVSFGGRNYLAYEFQKNGRVAGGPRQVALVNGHLHEGTLMERPGSQDGFLLQHMGRPLFFTDPRQIQSR